MAARSCHRLIARLGGSSLPRNSFTTSTFASSAEQPGGSEPRSWLHRLKGLFRGTRENPAEHTRPVDSSSIDGDFNLTAFADTLKKARQFGKLTQFGRGLPRGGEVIAQRSLERQEEILRQLAVYSPDGQQLTAQHKIDVAASSSCTVRDVEDVLGKYEWTREASRRIHRLKEEGKAVPQTLDEIEKMMGGRWKPSASVNLAKEGSNARQSRNSLCQCGSGNKYKRCCGKG